MHDVVSLAIHMYCAAYKKEYTCFGTFFQLFKQRKKVLIYLLYNTFRPFTVNLKVVPRISADFRHSIIRPRNISK